MFKKIKEHLFDEDLASNYAYRLKNALIYNIKLDSGAANMVRRYLNENYTRVSIQDKITSIWNDVLYEGNNDIVFYKVPEDEAWFWYKNAIIHVDFSHRTGNLEMKFIRGTVNIKKLMREAREYCRSVITEEGEVAYFNNFNIYEYHGTGSNGSGNVPRTKSDSGDVTAEDSEPMSSTFKNDTILNYTREDLIIKRRKIDPFDDLYYPKNVMDIVNDTNEWLKRKKWFLDRGLPWKRGILLHGPGGTGKSSFAKAMGKKFGLPVFHLYLSNMSDYEFKNAWLTAVGRSPAIVLLEDFDTVFNKRKAVNPESTLNFDTVLSTISGIQDSNGILLIITTNKIEMIDEAIGVAAANDSGISSRPGRIDKVLYLGAMDDANRYKLANKVLRDWPELVEEVVIETVGYTPAQVQEVCIQKALIKLHKENKVV